MNNLPKVVAQQRRGRASNPRLLDRKSDALPLSHRLVPLSLFSSLSLCCCSCIAAPHVFALYFRGQWPCFTLRELHVLISRNLASRGGSMYRTCRDISPISILSVSYHIGALDVGYFDISISFQ